MNLWHGFRIPADSWDFWDTYRSGIGDVHGGITHYAIPHQPFSREEGAGADWGDQDFRGLREYPFHSHVAQDRGHGLLQGFDHLWNTGGMDMWAGVVQTRGIKTVWLGASGGVSREQVTAGLGWLVQQ